MAGKRITDLAEAATLEGYEEVEVSQNSATVLIAAATISALAADNSFNDSAAGFIAAGFAEGDRVAVEGFTGDLANNIVVGTIETLTAGKMIIAAPEGDAIVDDAAGEAVTITKWVSRRATAQEIADLAGSGLPPGGTAGQALVKLSGTDFDVDWDDVASGGGGGGEAPAYIHVVDEKASGTNGGVPVNGWQTRTLNTVKVNTLPGASLAANDVTLPAGTYYVEASAPAYYVDRHRLRLRNQTAGTTLLLGQAGISPNDVANMASTPALLSGFITLAVPTAVRLEHYVEQTTANQGFGIASATGEVEIYANMVIEKVVTSGVTAGADGLYELIANIGLEADGVLPAFDVTGYRSVRMVYNLKKSGADSDFSGASFRFNGSATAYYSKNAYASGNGGMTADPQQANVAQGAFALLPAVSAGAPRLAAGGVIEFTGLDGALTKGWIDRNISYRVSDAGIFQHQVSGFWDNAAVVTSIAILTSFKAGSSIQVFGIRSNAAPGNFVSLSTGTAVTRAAATNVANSTLYTVVFTAEERNEGHWNSGDPTKLIVGQAGWYQIGFDYERDLIGQASSTDSQILLNGVALLNERRYMPGGFTGNMGQLSMTRYLVAGDAITFQVINYGGASNFSSMRGSLVRLGSGVSTASGVAFPVAPAAGDRFYRTDRKIEYTWDGARWLSTQIFSTGISSSAAVSADSDVFVPVPFAGVYSIWLERLDGAFFRTAAGEWDIRLIRRDAANASVVVATLDGAGDPDNVWVSRSTAINAVLDASARILVLGTQEISGAAGFYGPATLHYRLIG